jgi:hypothetical protein
MQDTATSSIDPLGILADVISDVGYWTWWASGLPDTFQIEFGGTQLLFGPPASQGPPPTKIAIQFRKPAYVFFISRAREDDNLEWADLLHADELEAPNCSHGEFSFGKNESTQSILEEVRSAKSLLGNDKTVSEILNQPHCLAFWCGDMGMAIGAEELRLLNHSGWIDLADIPDFNSKWWSYWRTYWNKRGTTEAFPKDYACEVTIPAGGFVQPSDKSA